MALGRARQCAKAVARYPFGQCVDSRWTSRGTARCPRRCPRARTPLRAPKVHRRHPRRLVLRWSKTQKQTGPRAGPCSDQRVRSSPLSGSHPGPSRSRASPPPLDAHAEHNPPWLALPSGIAQPRQITPSFIASDQSPIFFSVLLVVVRPALCPAAPSLPPSSARSKGSHLVLRSTVLRTASSRGCGPAGSCRGQ